MNGLCQRVDVLTERQVLMFNKGIAYIRAEEPVVPSLQYLLGMLAHSNPSVSD